jgi:hypothetical protein
MTTSAINNHIREVRAAVSDYCPRSHWAYAWREARVEGLYYDHMEPHEVILAAAFWALRERRRAEYRADVMTFRERRAEYKRRLADKRRLEELAQIDHDLDLIDAQIEERFAPRLSSTQVAFTASECDDLCEIPF